MTEMVERVARAMAEDDRLGAVADGPGVLRQSWRAYVPMARAAIEAMREPTELMVAAANRNNHPRDVDTWRTMIDAALNAPTTT